MIKHRADSIKELFQSTRPLRGATYEETKRIEDWLFQSTRPLRGATTYLTQTGKVVRISIHAPLAGRDRTATPAEEVRNIFQSTRPLRGATANVHKKYVHVCENRQKKLFSLPNAVCQSA